MSLTSASLLLAQEPALTPPPSAAVGGTAEVERVIVTGSNIPTAEEVGPNPVDTYRTEDIQKLGARTQSNFIQSLPVVTGGSINEGTNNGGDGRAEVNLRGLFPKETLVLIDGKRVAPVGFAQNASVDVNLVPFALVDHIDILKDGASAIYGSDAVGGVFNIFLKHKFRGLEIQASYGNSNLGASNDMGERDVYLLAGTGDDKTDIVVYAEDYDRAAIFSRDRNLTANADTSKFGGFDNRSTNFPGRVEVLDPATGRLIHYILSPNLVAPTPHSAADPTTSPDYIPIFQAPDQFRAFNFNSLTAAIPESDRQYFYGSATRQLCGDYLSFFTDFKYARTFTKSVLAPVPFAPDPFRQADGVTFVSGSGISVPLSNPFNPFTAPSTDINGNPITLADGTPVTTGVKYRALSAGERDVKNTANDYLFDAGLRGNLGELGNYFKTWNFEVGFRYNSDNRHQEISGLVNAEALRRALLSTDPLTAFNPFTRGDNSRAVLDQVLVTTNELATATLTDESALLNGDLFSLPAGPVAFALGTEHRKETVNDQPDALTTAFETIGGNSLAATRGSRDVWSYYGELRLPVTSPSWNVPGLHSLEFDVAERVEFYSDTNLAERPKFSVRYQPYDSSLTLRATYTEAFHAPNLSDLAPSRAETITFVFDPAFLDPDGNPILTGSRELSGGQPNLRPEVAYGWNYGFVWTPKFFHGLTLSLDFYHIDLRDRTALVDDQFIVSQNFFSNGRKFPGQVTRDAGGNIILITDLIQNISSTITEGWDYEAIYQFDTSILGHGNLGTLTATINGNYLARYVAKINSFDHARDFAGHDTFFAGYLPRSRFYTSLFYDLGGLDAGVTVHYIGTGDDDPGVANSATGDRKIRESTILDAIINYTFNFAAPTTGEQVAGYARDGGKSATAKDGKDKNVLPQSTAQYSECGWRAWVNNTTLTLGMNNIFDQSPPFGAGAFENNFETSTFDVRGRFWYVALKKRF